MFMGRRPFNCRGAIGTGEKQRTIAAGQRDRAQARQPRDIGADCQPAVHLGGGAAAYLRRCSTVTGPRMATISASMSTTPCAAII